MAIQVESNHDGILGCNFRIGKNTAIVCGHFIGMPINPKAVCDSVIHLLGFQQIF